MFGELLQKQLDKESDDIMENKRKISKNLMTLVEREIKRIKNG